jgi:hypothetical protein
VPHEADGALRRGLSVALGNVEASLTEDRILALFKFGQRKHIEELVVDGHLFMNPLSYFAALEADSPRSDKHEGTLLWLQPEKAKLSMEIDGVFREIPGIVGPMTYRNDAALRVNVYCMYALRAHEGSVLIDSRNFQFGDAYAVFTNGDEFLRRAQRAAELRGHKITWRPVHYVEPAAYHGPTGVFRKASKFSYQSEFRIEISPGTGQPLCLKVGDLSDIALTGDSASVNERIRLA